MLQYLARTSLLTILSILLFPSTTLADGFTLIEQAAPGRSFLRIVVTWTDSNHKQIPFGMGVAQTIFEDGPAQSTVPFDSSKEEKNFNLAAGTIHDWKQERTLDNGEVSTLEGVGAKKGSPFEILSYAETYSLLGLRPGEDFIFLPDFSADLDNDGFAETPLFSAINFFELARDFPQFVNNQPFDFGRSYTASDFTQFGFVFSLSDNIQFDPLLGYRTDTPYSPSGIMIANSTHITTADVPEPTTILLLASGLAGVAVKKLSRRFRR